MKRYREMLEEDDQLASRRASQARSWLWAEVNDYLLNALRNDPEVEQEIPRLEAAVSEGRLPPNVAARQLLDRFLGHLESASGKAPGRIQ